MKTLSRAAAAERSAHCSAGRWKCLCDRFDCKKQLLREQDIAVILPIYVLLVFVSFVFILYRTSSFLLSHIVGAPTYRLFIDWHCECVHWLLVYYYFDLTLRFRLSYRCYGELVSLLVIQPFGIYFHFVIILCNLIYRQQRCCLIARYSFSFDVVWYRPRLAKLASCQFWAHVKYFLFAM